MEIGRKLGSQEVGKWHEFLSFQNGKICLHMKTHQIFGTKQIPNTSYEMCFFRKATVTVFFKKSMNAKFFCLTPESTPELSKCVADPHCLWVKFCKSSPNFRGWKINKQQILNLPSQHVIHSSNFNCLCGPGISRSYQDLTCFIHGTWNQTSTGDKGVGFHETREKKRSMLYSSILHSRNWNYTRSKTYSIHSGKHGNGYFEPFEDYVLPIIENIFHCYLSLPEGTSTINHPCLLKYLPLLWHRHLFKCWHCWPNKIGRLLCSKAMPKRK